MENIHGGGGGGGGGAEIRRIHVIYFLSRKGSIEHPHLIRVHHLSKNGVHLRDVKRWLGELRGKDMPESFAWSYKRKYKSGYVWQDLSDEDLITPISDNEYVIKGSEISAIYTKDSYNENEKEANEEESPKSPLNKGEEESQVFQKSGKMEETNTNHCEIEQDLRSFDSEKSILSNNSLKVDEEEKHSQEFKKEIHEEVKAIKGNSSSSSSPSKKKNEKGIKGITFEEKYDTPRSCSSKNPHNTTFSRSKSYSNGATHLLRNLITCGTADTRDSTTVMINRRNMPSLNTNMNRDMSYGDHSFDQSTFDLRIELCKGGKLGGSQRVFGTSQNQQPQSARRSCDGTRSSSNRKNEVTNPKPNDDYKPVNGPQCSHCGKQFKPEKLHSHMKSCKGLKAFTKSNSSVSSTTKRFLNDNYSISDDYLTQNKMVS